MERNNEVQTIALNDPRIVETDYETPSKNDDALLKFVSPFSMLLVGVSNSGKSSYVRALLEKSGQVFTKKPSRIIYFYNIFQPLFAEMEQTIPNISFHQGLPDRAFIEASALKESHLVLVFDDLYFELINSKDMVDLTIMLCHHLNISCITTSHNIFMNSRFSKTLTTNIHYILLFTLSCRHHLSILGSQLFCHKKKAKNFVHAYDLVMQENRFSPLIIDISPHSDRRYGLRYRAMPGEYPIVIDIE